jgi:hypothetical protein
MIPIICKSLRETPEKWIADIDHSSIQLDHIEFVRLRFGWNMLDRSVAWASLQIGSKKIDIKLTKKEQEMLINAYQFEKKWDEIVEHEIKTINWEKV